ncbi:hypothetical protein HQ496_04490 [bacterium]|nr:hypothetical protein [bacterium]
MTSGTTKSSTFSFVELPKGIFTSDGNWYHTTSGDLRSFSSEVLDKIGLSALLQMAGEWSRIPVSVSIWVLPIMLPSAGLWLGLFATLSLYLVLSVISPSVIIIQVMSLVRGLNHPIAQGLFYVMMLSYFANTDRMEMLVIGLIGFIAFRWQLVDKILLPVVSRLRRKLSPLPVHDQILRNVIVRSAQKQGAPLAELDRMEKRVLEIIHYKRRKKKK